MQLLLDGSQCKWLVNLKRIAWALKDVAFTQERAGAALAEHVPRWRGAAAPGRRPLPPEGRSRVNRPRLDRAPPPLVRPLRARVAAPAEQPQVGDDEGDHEVRAAPDPGNRGGVAAHDHVLLVDGCRDDAYEERDPNGPAEVLAAQDVGEWGAPAALERSGSGRFLLKPQGE